MAKPCATDTAQATIDKAVQPFGGARVVGDNVAVVQAVALMEDDSLSETTAVVPDAPSPFHAG